VHMNDLARYGAPVYYFPMASRAPTCAACQAFRTPAPVTFVGTPMAYRIEVLNALIDAGVPLAIYGKFWKEGLIASPDRNLEKTLDDIFAYGVARLRADGIGALWAALVSRFEGVHGKMKDINPSLLHGFLPEADVSVLFRHSKINLGFTRMAGNVSERPGTTQLKLRDFEVPACGGFYIVEHAPEYAEFFADGREIEVWRTIGELIEKVRFYLDHESERAAIAVAGQRRALAEHLWTHRFSGLFSKLGIG
jgi:spore maturation protein CgeB